MDVTIQVIARMRSDFATKFGIPRQSGLVEELRSTIVFEPEFRNADALFEKGLVTEDEHKSGFYSYIDGVRADYTLDKCWWSFSKDGKDVMVGANDLKIADGDKFEITNTPA